MSTKSGLTPGSQISAPDIFGNPITGVIKQVSKIKDSKGVEQQVYLVDANF